MSGASRISPAAGQVHWAGRERVRGSTGFAHVRYFDEDDASVTKVFHGRILYFSSGTATERLLGCSLKHYLYKNILHIEDAGGCSLTPLERDSISLYSAG